jgi:hypothetical protein
VRSNLLKDLNLISKEMDYHEEVLDCSLDDFIKFLYQNPPMPLNQVIFDWVTILQDSQQPIDDLFQGLLEIWTKGMSILFGNGDGKVNLDYLTMENAALIEQYFNSMGFSIYFQRTSFEDPPQVTGRWPPPPPGPNQTGDRLCTRVLHLRSETALYEVSFDVLPA